MMLIIHDGNYKQFLGNGRSIMAGGSIRLLSLEPQRKIRPLAAIPFSQSSIDAGYGAGVVIPPSDYQARIQELEKCEARVSDHINFDQWNQNGLPYCWNNGTTQAASTTRVMQGQPFIHFSGASIGGPITGYVRRGGSTSEAMDFMVKSGAVDDKDWPNNAVDSSLDTAATRENRNNHKITQLIHCQSDAEVITTLLLGIPGAADWNWWSHCTMLCDCLWLDGAVAKRGRNSWRPWGDTNKWNQDGFFVLQGSKSEPDDYYAVVQVTAAKI